MEKRFTNRTLHGILSKMIWTLFYSPLLNGFQSPFGYPQAAGKNI